MLKNVGNPTLLLKLGKWRCVCMHRKRLEKSLLERIRPLTIGWFACWCDKADCR